MLKINDTMDGWTNILDSARIHEYKEPLKLDNITKPIICSDEEVLVKSRSHKIMP